MTLVRLFARLDDGLAVLLWERPVPDDVAPALAWEAVARGHGPYDSGHLMANTVQVDGAGATKEMQ